MNSWKEFAEASPGMAAFGKQRFQSGVAYLATVRADGGPRLHPVTPIVGEQLFVFMEPTSPKGKDLQHDGRYTLHCAVENMEGGGGEFYVSGRGTLVTDPAIRQQAIAAASYTPRDRYILFTLSVELAFMNVYSENGPNVKRYSATTGNQE